MTIPGITPQLPLAWRAPADARLDTFLHAPPGAIAALGALARGDAGTWVLVVGAPGTGKSHLLLGACAHAEARGRRAAYVPLSHARGRVGEAIAGADAASFVAIDGVEAIAGAREDEVALFEAHNRLRAAGVGVAYAATHAPDGLPLAVPDLRSRLAQCLRVVLEPLDDDGRADVLRARAERRGLALDPAAIDWLLRREGRELAHLTALLDRLDRASLAAQRRVTVPFLRQVLDRQ